MGVGLFKALSLSENRYLPVTTISSSEEDWARAELALAIIRTARAQLDKNFMMFSL